MIKQILPALIVLTTFFTCKGQENPTSEELKMDWELYDPPSTLVVPENKVKSAKYPFIDVHNHQFRMPTQDLGQTVAEMDKLNMAVMVNLSGRGRGSAEHLEQSLNNVEKNAPNRFIVFTNIDVGSINEPNWSENTAKQIEQDYKRGARGLKIYKSQTMTVIDGERISIDDVRIDPIWAKCGELGIPVLIHAADPKPFWQPHDENNERWLELKVRPRRKRADDDPAPWQTIIDEQLNILKSIQKPTL